MEKRVSAEFIWLFERPSRQGENAGVGHSHVFYLLFSDKFPKKHIKDLNVGLIRVS